MSQHFHAIAATIGKEISAVRLRLKVVWVFEANKDQAVASGQGERMFELTAVALREADALVSPVSAHVHFDTEEL